MLLQCPQETRAPAGWGSGLAGPGWTGPRLIILLLERTDTQWDTQSQYSHHKHLEMLVQTNNHSAMLWADVALWQRGEADDSFTFFFLLLPLTLLFYKQLPQTTTVSQTDQTAAQRCVWFSQHVWIECKTVASGVNSPEQFKAGKWPRRSIYNLLTSLTLNGLPLVSCNKTRNVNSYITNLQNPKLVFLNTNFSISSNFKHNCDTKRTVQRQYFQRGFKDKLILGLGFLLCSSRAIIYNHFKPNNLSIF